MKWVDWKEIDGTGYKVSNEGQVMTPGGKIYSPRVKSVFIRGEMHIVNEKDYIESPVGKIHQLVAFYFLPHPEAPKSGKYSFEGYHVHHINGNKKDNRAENLIYLTIDEHLKMHRSFKT